MSPLPGTRVVPEGWSRHHQPVATGGMNARCHITDPDKTTPGTPDPATGTRGPGTPHHVLPTHPDGQPGWPCRVQAVQSDEDTTQTGQDSTARRYLIQLDDPNLTTVPDVEVGHTVTILAAVNDPRLVGEAMTVTDVQHGSERFTRDLIAAHNQQTRTT